MRKSDFGVKILDNYEMFEEISSHGMELYPETRFILQIFQDNLDSVKGRNLPFYLRGPALWFVRKYVVRFVLDDCARKTEDPGYYNVLIKETVLKINGSIIP